MLRRLEVSAKMKREGGRAARSRSRDYFSLEEGHEEWRERAGGGGIDRIGASRVQGGKILHGTFTHLLGFQLCVWNNAVWCFRVIQRDFRTLIGGK